MLQAVMTAPGKIEFQEVAKPVCKADQVLIRVKNIGVCGSDIHVYHGLHPYTSTRWSKAMKCQGSSVRWANWFRASARETRLFLCPRLLAVHVTPADMECTTSAIP